jgi:hypothetical protein
MALTISSIAVALDALVLGAVPVAKGCFTGLGCKAYLFKGQELELVPTDLHIEHGI